LTDSTGGLPVQQVADIVDSIASALDFAHQRGLLHRDVKPSNILLTTGTDKRILLTDFGIGREIGSANGLTATGLTIGTVNSAAPEQLMGEDLDGRADQYALAATAYHLLCGHPLFEHSNPTIVISRHLNATPARLANHRPEFAFLDPVLQQALSKNPTERYPNCTQFAHALRTATAALEQSSHTPSPGGFPPASAITQHASIAPVLRDVAAPTKAAPAPAQASVRKPTTSSAGDTNPLAPTEPAAARDVSRAVLIAIGAVVVVLVAVVAAITTVSVMGSSANQQQVTATESLPAKASEPPSLLPTVPVAAVQPTLATSAMPPKPRIVGIPARNGSAGVVTRSGKTACQIMVTLIGCQVNWEIATPLLYGAPANGVRIYANGHWEWATGDMGTTATFTTLSYDTTYTALGWIIEPSITGTRFTNNATGHGIVVSTEGIDPF
jgi:serine/threonine-protein kinase